MSVRSEPVLGRATEEIAWAAEMRPPPSRRSRLGQPLRHDARHDLMSVVRTPSWVADVERALIGFLGVSATQVFFGATSRRVRRFPGQQTFRQPAAAHSQCGAVSLTTVSV